MKIWGFGGVCALHSLPLWVLSQKILILQSYQLNTEDEDVEYKIRKPWLFEPSGNQLEAYVGAFGVLTSKIETSEQLIRVAASLFGLQPRASVTEMAAVITSLGKKHRSRQANRNVLSLPLEMRSMKKRRRVTPGLFSSQTLGKEHM